MATIEVDHELQELLAALPPDQKRKVLEFVRGLGREPRRGLSGKDLLGLAGTITPEDLDIMERVIEEECERIDPDGW